MSSMMFRRRLPRDLSRYVQLRVVVTTSDGFGMDGFLEGTYADHIALVDAHGLAKGPEGQVIREPATAGPHVILLDKIVRLQVVRS